MEPEQRSLDDQDWYCSHCRREGFAQIPGWSQINYPACYVVCEVCGEESGYGWCPKCGMGGQFIKDLSGHPATWECPRCHSVYPLPSDFYDRPYHFRPVGPVVEIPERKPTLDYIPSGKARTIFKAVHFWLMRIVIAGTIGLLAAMILAGFGAAIGARPLRTLGAYFFLVCGAALLASAFLGIILNLVGSVYRLIDRWKYPADRRRFYFKLTAFLAAIGLAGLSISMIGKVTDELWAMGLVGSLVLFIVVIRSRS